MSPKPEAPHSNNSANVLPPVLNSELQRRAIEATQDLISIPKVDRFTGKLICYHAITCAPIGTPDAIDPNKIHITFESGSMKCVGARCSRWNPEELECFDNTHARAAVSTTKVLEYIDGHARMSAEK